MADMVQVKKQTPEAKVAKPAAAEASLDDRINSAIGKMPEMYAVQIRKLLAQDPSVAESTQQVELSAIRKLDGFKAASEATLQKIFTDLATQPEQKHDALRKVLQEPNFAKLDEKAQIKVLELAQGAKGLWTDSVVTLLKRDATPGYPLLTNSFDSKASTLLNNLHTFANSTTHPDVLAGDPHFSNKPFMMLQLLEEVTTPSSAVNQGDKGACAAASIQDLLCRRQPAEYVRLVTGLITEKTVDARGGKLTVVKDSLNGERESRSTPERLFQSAILNEAKSFGSYSYGSDTRTIASIPLGVGGGLNAEESKKGLDLLFGKDRYELLEDKGSAVHEKLKGSGRPGIVGMHIDGHRHALVYVRSDEQYVYLKDPNGAMDPRAPVPEGGFVPPRDSPPSEKDSNTRMTIADFEAHAYSASFERDKAPPNYLKQTLYGAADLALATSTEAEILTAAAAAATVPLQQEVRNVEMGLKVALPAVQQNVQNAITNTVSSVQSTVRFTALSLPPPPNPVQLWNQIVGGKK